MPMDLIRVSRIDSGKTSNPQVTSHLITGTTVDEVPRLMQFETINDLRASACQRAQQTHRFIWIWWCDTRYGKDIVKVQLDDSKWEHDQPPREKVI